MQTSQANGGLEPPPPPPLATLLVLTPFLTRIFNKCAEQETFPNDYKIAYVVPIPKVSSPQTFGDFRPISLLPIFSKLFEKIIEIRMRNFLNKNDILTASQYGFKTNTSTELAITTLYDKLLDNLNNKKTTCSIFVDLKKAFDSVSHDILLKKMEHYGFRGCVWKLLISYLKDRKICSKVDNSISKLHRVKFGVLQGSVLGPLFFLLHVNDLPEASHFETTLFADNTNLHLSHSNVKTL